jgi:L-cystine transport system substrate-binding protein
MEEYIMKKRIIFVLTLTLIVLLFTACSQNNAKTSGTAENPLVVKVGTMGTYEPFSYVDKDGKLTGYDIEVLRLIEKVDPTIKFDVITGPWDTLFPGLESDRFQMLANQITSNPDRQAKYLLTENTYALCVSQLIAKKGRTDITSLKDLEGRRSVPQWATPLPGYWRTGTKPMAKFWILYTMRKISPRFSRT